MGQYLKGDVILVPVALDDRSGIKTRPAVVIAATATGIIHICPVSSKPPSDAGCIPVSLDDFSEGGLDIFGESYVMTSRVLTLTSGKVIGKKGRLMPDTMVEILSQVPAAVPPGTVPAKKTGKVRKGQ